MASRLVQKLLIKNQLGRKVLCNVYQCSFLTKNTLSTQPNPKPDLKLDNINNGMSQWKLCAAVCLIRLPVVEEELSEVEKNFLEMQQNLEYKNSIYNSWELEMQRQNELMKEIEAGIKNPEELNFRESNQDLEDGYEATYNEFKAKSSEQLIEDEDMKNINRRPRESLVFVTKHQLGNDLIWMLPRAEWQMNETLRDSARRALDSHIGVDTGAFFTSNAPSGFYKYKFPKDARSDQHVGAKLFIYNAYLPRQSQKKATYDFDASKLDDRVLDSAWVARDEMRALLKPKYIAAIERIMIY